ASPHTKSVGQEVACIGFSVTPTLMRTASAAIPCRMPTPPPARPAFATPGLHHVTAIAGRPQANIDFYVRVLGLRLVKRTVTYDDPETYHFYFGDAEGTPGTLLTFFPWPGAGPGVRGAGETTAIALRAPANALDAWRHRLREHGRPFATSERFGQELLA